MKTPKTPYLDEQLLADTIRRAPAGDVHIFGYGSLIWRPGFRYRAAAPARVYGYHRRCAIRSTHYRGTPDKPGLVLGLDCGGSCNGIVYRVAAADGRRVIRYLFRREMFADAYHPRYVRAVIGKGGKGGGGKKSVTALTFVVRKQGRHYAPPMPPAQAAKIIAGAAGFGGGNRDYFDNTRACLRKSGLRCRLIDTLCELLAEG